ncbi:hypothetical protein SAMN05216174_12542 [Actinokineospora iranica]|uniref:Uncharacterized protein n=1 Tax=Actinokineospora iranica TaxID=1271860 RepID=A0A1G6Z611_9PSEU|nr:hypothetical protein SAMN05216174_12542 [Actinokineospora iranica]
MVENGRLDEDLLVAIEIMEHAIWGMFVRVVDYGTIGVVDALHVTDERPFQPVDDYRPSAILLRR